MVYTFGNCALDTQLYTVQRAGQSIRLRPKVFQMLRYLLEHRNRVVPKDELAAHVWPGQCISDATLESTLRAVRRALGDTGRTQHLIQALPETPERRQQELSLQMALSVALILTHGYTAPEVEATCAGARALCQDSGDTPHLFFPVYGLFLCSLWRGRLHAAREPAELHQGLAAYQTSGANGWRSYCLGIQAEAQGKGGQPTEGLRGVEDALALAGTAGEQPWYEAELYRRKGELLLAQADPRHRVDEAAACCSQALDVARRQQARALERRAALSLARLWRRQGKRTDAYQLLGEVYGWFTEGFDTADLQDARVLLEALVG